MITIKNIIRSNKTINQSGNFQRITESGTGEQILVFKISNKKEFCQNRERCSLNRG